MKSFFKMKLISILFLLGSSLSNADSLRKYQTNNSEVHTYPARKFKSTLKSLGNKTHSVRNGRVRKVHKHEGLRVIGSELVYHIKNGKIRRVSGRRARVSNLKTIKPKLSKSSAVKVVKKEINNFLPQKVELVIYPLETETLLAYELIEKTALGRKAIVYLDATTGKIINAFDGLNHGVGIGVNGDKRELSTSIDSNSGKYVLKHEGNLSFETLSMAHARLGPFNRLFNLKGKKIKSADDVFSDKAAVDAHYFTGKFLELLKNKFNRNSFDNKGTKIKSFVHVSMNFSDNYVNAFWDGKAMSYGDGDGKNSAPLSGALDVVAHEITHGITTSTSKLRYLNESGALNESFSDIMASFAEYNIQRSKFDWKLGEDVWTPGKAGDALRYMDNPTKDRERRPKSDLYSRDYYPERYKGTGDNGGVHLNSGIINLAFHLLVEGGTHPRGKTKIRVKGIGMEKAMAVFYLTFTEALVSSSNFQDAKEETILTAQEILSSSEVKSVQAAWKAVGI